MFFEIYTTEVRRSCVIVDVLFLFLRKIILVLSFTRTGLDPILTYFNAYVGLCFVWQDLQSLRHMNLNRCRNLTESPDLSKARSLESLCLCECESLVELLSSLGHLDKLVKVSMMGCTKLKSLPCDVKLISLKILFLDECTNIKAFPFVSDNIEELGLRGTSIEEVPPCIDSLSRLSRLRLSQCKRLKNLPDTFGNLKSLKTL